MISFRTHYDIVSEKLVTFGGGRPEFNQVVIMAGGAGSGKGFVLSKLIGIEGKVFDVDVVKTLLINSTKYADRVKKEMGVDVKRLDLKTDVDVSTLHQIEKDLNISDKRVDILFKSIAQTPDAKPNLIFDVTLKDIEKLKEISDAVIEIGYKKENIHVVWVINELQTAIDQNAQRSRRVKSDILMKTHEGVSATVAKIIKNENVKLFMDGDFWLVFNKKGVDSFMHKSELGGSYVKDALYFKIKDKKGQMLTLDEIADKTLKFMGMEISVVDKIKAYVPDGQKWTNEGLFMAGPGEDSKLLDKFITTFWKQNKWHKHGVFLHTLGVVFSAIKSGDYRMIPAAFLHDIGKPGSSTRDAGDLSYSFNGHEEASYDIIKNWSFISKYTKELVRWHYLIRGKAKAKEKFDKTGDEKYLKEYERQKAVWDSLDDEFKKELQKFLKHDDNGKDISSLLSKYE